ncbi:MAG TPA: hydroxymethylbilane synthase [Nitrososphaerales archaeon]|nr:hydroxymethylbilane synthase [Nitrososphaerales archaeon]
MKEGRPIIIGTRGSDLAMAQANIVANLLKRKNKGLKLKIMKIKTEGDSSTNNSKLALTGKDLFTRAIDKALEEKMVDIAVHSLKDLPVENSESSKLEIGAYPKRENPSDVLISKRSAGTLENLPHNARVGTSSVRRAVQLKHVRPDIEIVELHGNVETRINKLRTSKLDAIVLAKSGLKRLGRSNMGKIIPHNQMLPAIGQGCLAVTIRKNDKFTKWLVSKIDDGDTRCAVSAERAFSKELGGGCNTPIAALATIRMGKIVLDGLVEKNETSQSSIIVRGRVSGQKEDAENLGKALAIQLKKMNSGE